MFQDAASTVAATVKSGVDIAAMELLDDNQMRTINMVKATNRTWAEKPTLFIKFAGTILIIKHTPNIRDQVRGP